MDTETPLCTRCIRPVRPHDYYCENCGEAVGQFTAYLPFIDIRFQADFLGAIWKRFRDAEAGVAARSGAFALLLVLAPFMLVFGLPIWLWHRLRGHA